MFEIRKMSVRALTAAALLALAIGCTNPTVPTHSDDQDEEPRDNPDHSYLIPAPDHSDVLARIPVALIRDDEPA